MTQQRGSGRRGRGGRDDGGEALRGLVGAGPSKVGISAALRARDASRAGDDDIAAAEAMPPPRVGPPVTTQSRTRESVPNESSSHESTPNESGQPGNGGSEPSAS